MKKNYESPTIEIEEFEIENILCNFLSGGTNSFPNGLPDNEHEGLW